MIAGIFTDQIDVRRRAQWDSSSLSRDSLNNPVYGEVNTDYQLVYENINVRMQFSGKSMVFVATGELIKPSGILYYPPDIVLLPQDRIITKSAPGYPSATYPSGIEYVVESFVPAFLINGVVDHYEATINLPIA